MNFNWIQIVGIALLILSAIILLLGIWIYLDERNIQKNRVRRYSHQNQETIYTEEEKFYANLLLKKHELDADAFKTRKAMFDEALKHQNDSFK